MKEKLSDRYLSSKITHNKGDFREIPWENWEVVINFLDGDVSKSFKRECSTEKEAKKLESKALSIIQLAITDPKNEFFKTTMI